MIRARPARLNIINSKILEHQSNFYFIAHTKADSASLRTIAQS